MGKMDVHFSSASNEWATPQEFFNRLNQEFNFNLDPCATPESAKCPMFFTQEQNGLNRPWGGYRVFMNPPYGREIGRWIEKAYTEAQAGALVVCLIPARTDTTYWHQFCMKAREIRFVRGRLKFRNGNKRDAAPFPSAVVVFAPKRWWQRFWTPPPLMSVMDGGKGEADAHDGGISEGGQA